MADHDLVVVGGGFTGLAAAARFLADHPGASVKVLEASDRVGGRARDVPWPGAPGLRIDSGAQYVGDSQVRVLALLRELYGANLDALLFNGPAARWDHRHEVMHLGGRRYVYDNARTVLPGVPTQIRVEDYAGLAVLVTYLEWLERRVDVVDPKQSASVWPETLAGLDGTTVATWVANFPVTETVRDLVRITIEALLSVDPHEISMLAFLWYTACNEGMMHAVEDGEGGPQQYWLRTGLGSVAEAWVQAKGLPVQTGAKVVTLDASQPSAVTLTLATGAVITAERVVVALSPRAARALTYTPQLPDPWASTMAPRMGRTIKARLFYSYPWWRATNGFSHNGYAGGTGLPVLWVMDNSVPVDPTKPDVQQPCLMTFTVAGRADAWAGLTDAEVLGKLAEGVRDLFNDERALHVTGGVVHRWEAGEPIAGGGPSCFPNPGELVSPVLQTATAWDVPWRGNVRFACSEMSRTGSPERSWSRYNGWISEVAPTYHKGVRTNPGVTLRSRYSDHRAFRGYVEGALRAGDDAGDWASATLVSVLGAGGGRARSLAAAQPASSELPPLPRIPKLGDAPSLTLVKLVQGLAVLLPELEVMVGVAQAAVKSRTPYDVEAHTRAVSGVFELAALATTGLQPLPPAHGLLPSPDPVGSHLDDVARRLAQARADAGAARVAALLPSGVAWTAVVRFQHAWSRWRARGGSGPSGKAFHALQTAVDERFLAWTTAAGAARQARRERGSAPPAPRWPRFDPPGMEGPQAVGGEAAPADG